MIEIPDGYEDCLLCNGFEKALIGFGSHFHHPVAIYDYNKCVKILMEDGCESEEEAIEHMEFNVTGAWMGDSTPVFMREIRNEDSTGTAGLLR